MEHVNKKREMRTLQAHAVKLVDLVEYQEESIVSRTLIDRKSGTVTLFAFDKGTRIKRTYGSF